MRERRVFSWGDGSAALLALLGILAASPGAVASDDPNGALSKDEQKCVVEINKNAAKVAKAQGKRICKCIKDVAKGKLPAGTIEACVSGSNPKVTKATGKLKTKVNAKCAGQTPGFGVDPNGIDPNSIIAEALEREVSLIHWFFGSNLDAAIVIIDKAADKTGDNTKDTHKCQLDVAKAAKKCFDTKWKVFIKCKKNGMKGKVPPGQIDSANDLETLCLQDPNENTGQPDPKQKINKVCVTKLQAKIQKKCIGKAVDLTRAFPLFDPNAGDLRSFVDEMVECEFCRQVNATDGLNRDCDLFDNGVADGSCPSGAAALSHFKLYDVTSLFESQTVSLADQFFSDPNVFVQNRAGLLNPVEKSVGVCAGGTQDTQPCVEELDCPGGQCTDASITPIGDPAAHLTSYRVFPLGAVRLREYVAVEFSNQFGSSQRALLSARGRRLLVPARKNELGPSPTLDHYRCYSGEFVEDFPDGTVRLVDQFVDETVSLSFLRRFCNPVNKNGEGILNPAEHLACYAIFGSDPNVTVDVGDQFDPSVLLQVGQATELCVPSQKLDVGICGDGVVAGPLSDFENCEPTDDSLCPGRCGPDCRCDPECPEDPTRTVFVGGPNSDACRSLVDELSCEVGFHLGDNGVASCFWDGFDCVGCGGNNGEPCTNTCVPPPEPPTCEGDPTRTNFVGGPDVGFGGGACRSLGDQLSCEAAFHLGDNGVASCFWDGFDCVGCGGNNGELCTNTCEVPPTCEGDPTRTNFAGGPFAGDCQSFIDQASCETAFHLGGVGIGSCVWDAVGGCLGCAKGSNQEGPCTNTCLVAPGCGDPTRTNFVGGPDVGVGGGACRSLLDEASCETAYHQSGNGGGVASCWWALAEGCIGCGFSFDQEGFCANTCRQ